ncbi:HEAT repeat domain-containing protein [Mastigocoleus testarum]|uniref:HEAT repeat domain-containing protein n=1 Tax=Mastigocoleus testarum TaxID=996925 RepID=UPI0007C7BADC|nr:HEAT repeat domain-containing protein [Mastigocoleus testarum]
MVNPEAYLRSLCKTYAQWWDYYTLTDVVGKKQHERKLQSPLLDIGLMVETIEEQKESKEKKSEQTERLTVLDGLRKYAADHVLLVGRPGSGKSTALVRLLLEEAQNYQENKQIPILVELRFYQSSIIDLIHDFLLRHDPNLPIDGRDVTCNVSTLLRQGKFLLLMDGVNELPSEAARRDLYKFRQDYQNTTPMVFTTRDLGVGGDLGLEKKLQMQPLTEKQMREFVCAYLPQQGEDMLKQLEGRLREFGETPLLLWMLCSVFTNNQNKVPANLGSVFRRFTEIYDKKLKQDIPVTDESRRWWKRLLQHLAWVMTQGESKTEILVAIPRQQAETILAEFLRQQGYHQHWKAEKWLDDLLKHHLIQLGAENQIQFRHQLLQEYYTAERLLEEISNLSDDELQWDYLNYLKWTEPIALMMQLLDVETQNFASLRLVKLALEVDLQLGARLAGEVKAELQEKTVSLVESLEIPPLLKIRLLEKTKSHTVVPELIKLLENEHSDVRYGAAYALGEIKSETAIPGLIKLLEHEDSNVRYGAEYALGKIKSEAAIPGLLKLLEYEDSDVRYRVGYILGKIKSETVIPGLIKLLEYKDSDVRYRAAEALGKIKSETVIPGLIKLLEDEDIHVRYRAVEALGEIKYDAVHIELIKLIENQKPHMRSRTANMLGKTKLQNLVSVLIKLLKDEESYVRYCAIHALGQMKSHVATLELIKLLKDPVPDIRYVTADSLGKIKSNTTTQELIKLLIDKESYVRSSAAYALGEIKSEAAIPELIKLLEDEDSSVRSSAAHALGEIKSETAIPELIKLLEDEDSSVRSSAAHALGEIKSETAIPELIKLLEDEDSSVRSSTAYALGEIKSETATPGLIKLLEHQDSFVRFRAATALGKIKSETAIPGLIKLLEHQDSFVRSIAAHSLGEIKSETSIPELIKILEHQDLDVRSSAATALGEIKSETAIPGLIKLLENRDSDVRYSAAYALGKIKSETAIPGLIKLLEHQDSDVRCTAVIALGEIKSKTAIIGLTRLIEDEHSDVRCTAAIALGEIKSETAIPGLIRLIEDEQTPFFDFATEDFPVALLRGGKGLPEQGYESVKAEAEEKIRSISNQVQDGVGIVGDGNIGVNIGQAGNITFGNISSGNADK